MLSNLSKVKSSRDHTSISAAKINQTVRINSPEEKYVALKFGPFLSGSRIDATTVKDR